MDVALDTSVLIALLDPQNLCHSKAVALHSALQSAGFTGICFDSVVAETISTATRRLREKKRAAEIAPFLDRIIADFPAGLLTWVSFDIPILYREILSLIRSSGGYLNFNDALIALSCRERGIRFIASFDQDSDHLSWLHRLERAGDLP